MVVLALDRHGLPTEGFEDWERLELLGAEMPATLDGWRDEVLYLWSDARAPWADIERFLRACEDRAIRIWKLGFCVRPTTTSEPRVLLCYLTPLASARTSSLPAPGEVVYSLESDRCLVASERPDEVHVLSIEEGVARANSAEFHLGLRIVAAAEVPLEDVLRTLVALRFDHALRGAPDDLWGVQVNGIKLLLVEK